MSYSHKQKRVAYHLYDVGRRKKASRKELLAALETGLVEANLQNPAYGDLDSVGWRQERGHYGSVGKRRNVRGAAGRFYDETKAAGRGKGKTAGQLAQAVQRSAHPGRYDARRGQAKDLLNWLERKHGKGGGAKAGGSTTTKTTTSPGVDNSALRQSVKRTYLSERGRPDALLSLAAGLRGAEDVPATTKVVRRKSKGATVKGGGGGTGKQQARRLAAQAGKGYITSGERTPERNRAVGGAEGSDHLTTKRDATAVDLKYGTGRRIARRLGIKNWKPGSYQRHTVRIKGKRYSVQILEDVEGHRDHTHAGFQYLGR